MEQLWMRGQLWMCVGRGGYGVTPDILLKYFLQFSRAVDEYVTCPPEGDISQLRLFSILAERFVSSLW